MKVVTYRAPIDTETNNTVIKETRCEDPIAFIQEMRASHKKGYLYNIWNVAEESGVALRDAMNAELISHKENYNNIDDFICIKAFVMKITEHYSTLKATPGFNSDTKEMYLVPSYDEFLTALKNLAYKATGREVTEAEICEAYDISPIDYYDMDCLDWENITGYILENFVDEPEYLCDVAVYGTDSYITGWDYSKEQVIESEYTCLDNYSDLEDVWKAEIVSNLRSAMSKYTIIGGIDVDTILSDADIVDNLIDEIKAIYPFPSEDSIVEDHLDLLMEEPDYDPDWR